MRPTRCLRLNPILRRSTALAVALFCVAIGLSSTHAEDWPEWRGKGRTGVWTEDGILEKFPEDGLEVKWRTPIHGGYAGPAVAAGRVFVVDFERSRETRAVAGAERALCLDEKTGRILWSQEWPVDYRMLMVSYAIGPRATPTIDGDRVYVLGAAGNLLCLDVATGDVIWKKDYIKEFGTNVPTWGVTSAPLVDGDRLICIVGGEPDGKVMAFDKTTGKELWRAISSDWEMGYCQPVIFEAGGVRQLIIWEPRALNSLDPATGRVYWSQPFAVKSGLTVATPVKSGPPLFVSQFYGGPMLMELDTAKPEARMLWKGKSQSELPNKTDGLHALITTPVIDGDYIYGVGSYGHLRCLELATGRRVWETLDMTELSRWAAAFFVRHGDRYFVNNDLGDLMIVDLSPEGYREIDRTKLIEPTTSSGMGRGGRIINWSHPAYANRHIFARNDNEIICVSLAKE